VRLSSFLVTFLFYLCFYISQFAKPKDSVGGVFDTGFKAQTQFWTQPTEFWNQQAQIFTRQARIRRILTATIDDWCPALEKRFRLASSQASTLPTRVYALHSQRYRQQQAERLPSRSTSTTYPLVSSISRNQSKESSLLGRFGNWIYSHCGLTKANCYGCSVQALPQTGSWPNDVAVVCYSIALQA
jgi:hypothetical protein